MSYKIEAVIEALLFAAGDEVELKDISNVTGLKPKETETILFNMMEKYKREDRGIMLRQLGSCWQLCTKPELYDDIKSYFEPRSVNYLSNAAMETLSIIAYNQPITRGKIESIRGVNCDGVIHRLLEKKMICELGKADTPGRPTLYGTTVEFLRALGYDSLEQLPKIETEENLSKPEINE